MVQDHFGTIAPEVRIEAFSSLVSKAVNTQMYINPELYYMMYSFPLSAVK